MNRADPLPFNNPRWALGPSAFMFEPHYHLQFSHEFKSRAGTKECPSLASPCSYSLASCSPYISSSFVLPHKAAAHRFFLSVFLASRSRMLLVLPLGPPSKVHWILRAPSR